MQLESVFSLNGIYQYSILHWGNKETTFQNPTLDFVLAGLIQRQGCEITYCYTQDNLQWVIFRNFNEDDSVRYLFLP